MVLNTANIRELKISDYLGKEFDCNCGRKHRVDIDKIIIGKGALQQIPAILSEYKVNKVLLVADTNTYKAAGAKVEQLVQAAGFGLKTLVFEREGDLVPDETAIGQLFVAVEKDMDIIVAVGSGVINDLAKYISSRLEIPFIIVASAPSMDGFTSDVSALILDNLKTSPSVQPAKVIIGDVEVLKDAPMRMIVAGLGDLLGKYSSLRDWKIGHIINSEYYCPAVAELVQYSVQKSIDNIERIKNRDESAIQGLMEGLVLSGIAMSFVGNSRPASGAEHHISHYWETMFLLQGKSAVLHGIKVGIGALITHQIATLLMTQPVDFERAERNAACFDEQRWEAEVTRLFQRAAPGILKQSRDNNRNSVVERRKRVQVIRRNWDQVLAALRETPSATELKAILLTAGAPVNPQEVGVDSEMVYQSIIYAKEIRVRYTILQLLWDLGLSEEYAAAIKSDFAGI